MDGKLLPVALFETREFSEASHFFGILLQKIYIKTKKLCLPDALKDDLFFFNYLIDVVE